jgi:hypothetical protein
MFLRSAARASTLFAVQPRLDAGADHPVHEVAAAPGPGHVRRQPAAAAGRRRSGGPRVPARDAVPAPSAVCPLPRSTCNVGACRGVYPVPGSGTA